MILHIFSDSPYTYRFIDFANKTFDPADHNFVILLDEGSRFLDFYRSNKNCQLAFSRLDFLKVWLQFYSANRIIFHQLNQPRLLLFLSLFYPKGIKKGIWSVWGGDAYFHVYKKNTLKDFIIYSIFSHVIKRLATITAYIPGDYDVVRLKYGSKAKYIQSKYPSPIDVASLKHVCRPQSAGLEKTILVGNSGDPSNEHIHIFNLISKFKNNDIKVVSVLSYGGTREYVADVIDVGTRTFGDKFCPVTEYMPFQEYLDFTSKADICIFNHKRSQGLGNVFLFLALGGKVFISNETSPFKYYKSVGIEVFATEDIPNLTFENFCELSPDSRRCNKDKILAEIDYSQLKLEWGRVFND